VDSIRLALGGVLVSIDQRSVGRAKLPPAFDPNLSTRIPSKSELYDVFAKGNLLEGGSMKWSQIQIGGNTVHFSTAVSTKVPELRREVGRFDPVKFDRHAGAPLHVD